MYLLFETPAGYALFKCSEKKASTPEDISQLFLNGASATKAVNLKAFSKFSNTAEALSAATELAEGVLPSGLKKFLKKEFSSKETLAVGESKLAKAISRKLNVSVDSDSAKVQEWMRGVRSLLPTLLGEGVEEKTLGAMSLGLAHSLSRFRLKFSSDRVDSMVIQAVALLDDLDKELNTYSMRLKEWYGWHFPELCSVITDTAAYARVILKTGFRSNVSTTDFSDILPEDLETKIKSLAETSMGTEMTEADLEHIQKLAEQVIGLSEYRSELADYLRSRMIAVAPNLTALLGELVGARLIAHSGSLMQLAKQPASTVQLLGAEKALFRALKTKQPTPKYGLLFHSSLVGQAAPKLKGKIARVLAAKAALTIRVDAMSRDSEQNDAPTYTDGSFGLAERGVVEARLRQLEKRVSLAALGSAASSNKTKYNFVSGESVGAYQPSADLPSLVPVKRPLVTEIIEESAEKKRKPREEDKEKKDKEKKGKDKKDKEKKDKEKKGKDKKGKDKKDKENDEGRKKKKTK